MDNTLDLQKNPKVTIIMPSLNVKNYIEQCIESACSQTLRDIEIICVDAGSTDGTYEILKQYANRDTRIKVIHSQYKSYGYQMNLGLENAHGEYIAVLETDDYVDNDMYNQLYSIAKENKVDVVKSNYYRHSGDKDIYFEALAGLPYNRVITPNKCMSLFMRAPAIWTGLYRRDFLEANDIKFLETPGASYQDTGFILKVWISAKCIYFLKNAFLHYRTDNPNSSVKSLDKMLFVRDEMKDVYRYLDERPEKKKKYSSVIWDREADAYEWNFRRLTDNLKYVFLKEVQGRFREGLNSNNYARQYFRWDVWKMILEVAEDPMIYLYLRLDREIWEQVAKEQHVSDELRRQCKDWAVKEKRMLIPQTMIDITNFSKNYGFAYCIRRVLEGK